MNQQQMQCMEVWSGSQLTAQGVSFGGLDAWVYSKPYGGAKHGGDIYYASSCATGRITRLLLADVSGHGKQVASTAADLRTLMRRFVNRLDQAEFVELLNKQFASLSAENIFATAVVTTFFAPTARLTICNAAHPAPLLYRKRKAEWTLLSYETSRNRGPSNLPLGVLDITSYEQFDIELEPGDLLISYTDALIESRDANGEMLDERGLLRIVRLLGDIPPQDLIPALLREIGERYTDNLVEDDVTMLVVQANGLQPRLSFKEKAGAFFRLAGSVLRAVNPRAERPPLPEMNLANFGGAFIPALSKLWKARNS
jgi:serine phosphatase RsbU (regulator of sigma subunit)